MFDVKFRKVFPAVSQAAIENDPAFQTKTSLLETKKELKNAAEKLLDELDKKGRGPTDDEPKPWTLLAMP